MIFFLYLFLSVVFNYSELASLSVLIENTIFVIGVIILSSLITAEDKTYIIAGVLCILFTFAVKLVRVVYSIRFLFLLQVCSFPCWRRKTNEPIIKDVCDSLANRFL